MYDKTTPVRKYGLHDRDTGSSRCPGRAARIS